MRKVSFCSIILFYILVGAISLLATEISTDTPESNLDLSGTAGVIAASPEVIIESTKGPKLRWGDDRLIYGGEVYSNSWVVMADSIDDDAIDVDFFAGDTLRAVVACPDSILRVFRSNDGGQNWSQVSSISFGSGGVGEPHIVHGPDSTYHVFCHYNSSIDDIYTIAYRTPNDAWISGTNQFLSGSDTVQNYSVCTDRVSNHDYSVFLAYHVYHGGRGMDQIYITSTSDQGQNWSAPSLAKVNGSGFPDITYSNNRLYLTYLWLPSATSIYRVRNCYSTDGGTIWSTSISAEEDTFPKMGPQIAAATDGSGDVWTIWSKQNLDNANDDWGLRWSWSQDSAVTWSTAGWVNSFVNYQEILPSIAVYDAYGTSSNVPYVSYVKSYYDWSGDVTVRSFNWDSGSWTSDTSYADSTTIATRPIQTFAQGGPAIAYVGENSENVYFDSWDNSSGIEDDIVVSNDKIECSLDQSIIIGTASLSYTLSAATNVEVSLVNILGQKVATFDSGDKDSGEHTVSVSAENLSQGVYYILITTDTGQKGITKATVLK